MTWLDECASTDRSMREYKIFAPADGIVSSTAADNVHAPRQIDARPVTPHRTSAIRRPCRSTSVWPPPLFGHLIGRSTRSETT